jgi:hypothetical protein
MSTQGGMFVYVDPHKDNVWVEGLMFVASNRQSIDYVVKRM